MGFDFYVFYLFIFFFITKVFKYSQHVPVTITVITVPNNAVNIVMVDPVTTQTDFVHANLVILETDVTEVGLSLLTENHIEFLILYSVCVNADKKGLFRKTLQHKLNRCDSQLVVFHKQSLFCV